MSCGIIVHVLHRVAGSAVMIVQCGTTTNVKHDVWWKSIPRIVVARFLADGSCGRKSGQRGLGKAELFKTQYGGLQEVQ